MEKSFEGMHENYDSIRFSVNNVISISMIVTSVLFAVCAVGAAATVRTLSVGVSVH